jgi:hypothetical protein
MAVTIKLRRGLKIDLPVEAELGEALLTTDTQELYFGRGPNNTLSKVGAVEKIFNLTSQVNSVLREFTCPTPYVPGSLKIYLNGMRLFPEDYVENSPSTGKFTFNTAPIYNIDTDETDTVLVDCRVVE